MWCGIVRSRIPVEITAFGDTEPRFIDGAWEWCLCGPNQKIAAVAPSMGDLHGPAIPTPEDLLHAAMGDLYPDL